MEKDTEDKIESSENEDKESHSEKKHHDEKHHSEEKHHEKHKEEKHVSGHAQKIKQNVWLWVCLGLAVILVISIFTHGFSFMNSGNAKQNTGSQNSNTNNNNNNNLGSASGDVVKLDFYVMSKCPYGIQVLDAIKPVIDQLGKRLQFSVNYIATDSGSGSFSSLHGDTEVQGDIAELCAAKYNPDKYMDMVVCMNQDSTNIPTNWQSCAKTAGLDVSDISACYSGTEGKTLLSDSIKASNGVNAQGSPTMYLDGATYSGGRQSSDFLRNICQKFTQKPDPCNNIPEPTKINLIVLNDKRCKTCDVANIVTQLQQMFPGLAVKTVDYKDADGAKLYSDLNLTNLPALLFDSSIKKDASYSSVQQYLDPKGDYLNLRIGASFDPTAEICDNGIDDNGDGKIDCADPECTGSLVCRQNAPQKLDLFVMSHCPYGVLAMNAMKQVLDNFKGNINFSINYIASDNGDGTFTSLHGQTEVDEDLRELCVMKYYPQNYKYMDYIWCRNNAITSTDWETCAKSAGMQTAMIKTCAEGSEGKALLSASIKATDALSISASPSWLVNNKVQFSGLDAQTIKTNFCNSNSGLNGCENTLNSTNTAGVASGNCG